MEVGKGKESKGGAKCKVEIGGGKEGKGGRNLRWRSERERKAMGAECKVKEGKVRRNLRLRSEG